MKIESDGSKPNDSERDDRAISNLNWLNRTFLGFLCLGLVAIFCYAQNLKHAAVATLWALACLAAGAFVGMLFGIKREQQPTTAPPPANPSGKPEDVKDEARKKGRYQPNNNLIDVSDWLTKIIVGLGLVELRNLPQRMKVIASPLASALGEPAGLAVAVGIIVFASFAGFLIGYINSRTFLAALFSGYDDLGQQVENLKDDLKETAAKQEAQKVSSVIELQGIRTLVSAQGGVPASDQPGPAIPAQPDPKLLQMAQAYKAIDDPDYSVRVARKDKAADEMLRYIIEKKIPKQALHAWTLAQPSDGLIVALAFYVQNTLEEGDLAMLLSVAKSANWLHAKYYVTLALLSLARRGFGKSSEWKEVMTLLDIYSEHARQRDDNSLLALIAEIKEMAKPKLS